MKKVIATMAAMLLTVVSLSACTAKAKQVSNETSETTEQREQCGTRSDYAESRRSSTESQTETTKKEVMSLKEKKALVAYFSWSGNTKV